jgi:hypothetical protein
MLSLITKQDVANRIGDDPPRAMASAGVLETGDYRRGEPGSDGQFEAIIGRKHFDLGAAPADRLEPLRLSEDVLDHPVV